MICGSNIAKDIDMQFRKEQKYKQRQFEQRYCSKCQNFNTNLCNITMDIQRNLRCVEFKKIAEPCEMVDEGLCLGCTGLGEKDWERKRKMP